MNKESGKIQNFTDLAAWQEAHRLAVLIYKITKIFPREEIFGLTSQMRRCAVSVVSNIAEGFARRSYLEKMCFYDISIGSLVELQSQLRISEAVSIIKNDVLNSALNQTIIVHKLLNGLISGAKRHIAS